MNRIILVPTKPIENVLEDIARMITLIKSLMCLHSNHNLLNPYISLGKYQSLHIIYFTNFRKISNTCTKLNTRSNNSKTWPSRNFATNESSKQTEVINYRLSPPPPPPPPPTIPTRRDELPRSGISIFLEKSMGHLKTNFAIRGRVYVGGSN